MLCMRRRNKLWLQWLNINSITKAETSVKYQVPLCFTLLSMPALLCIQVVCFLVNLTVLCRFPGFNIICWVVCWWWIGMQEEVIINPLNTELNPICYLPALLAHHFLHGSRIRVKSLTLRLLMSYIYGAPILDVSRSHTTTPQAARLLRSWVQIPPGAWIFVCCECRVLSGRGLCDELITRPEESYRLCWVIVCDLETSRIGAPYIYIYIYIWH